jgi:protein-disulfide isomerase
MKSLRTMNCMLVALCTLASCSDTRSSDPSPSHAALPAPDTLRNAPPVPPSEPTKAAPRAGIARHLVPIAGLPSYGPKDALVTVVEVTDYDCPYCERAELTIHALRERHDKDLRIVVLENPLPMHPRARAAALAALSAEMASPGRFEAMHSLLFQSKGKRSDEDLLSLAVEAGAPRRAYEAALASERPREALEQAQRLAKDLHVTGTPAFFVNGRRIDGAQPLATFEAIVDEELVHARAIVAAGVPRDSVYEAISLEARENPAPLRPESAAEPASFVPAAKGVGGAMVAGVASAPVTMVVFTDLECPYCARLDSRLRELTEKRKDVRVVLRHSPLPMHEHGELAARAAIAADAQGKLGAFIAVAFANQAKLDRSSLEAHARAAGLDAIKLTQDMDAKWVTARLAEDLALARKLDVRGTPTVFVESERIVGAQPLATFEHAIDEAARRP